MQDMAMFEFIDKGRVVNRQKLLVAVVIGEGHKQIEALPVGRSEAVGVFGSPIAAAASYINPAIPRPWNGGLNQRERRKSDSFLRISLSRTASNRPVAAAPQMNGFRIHLLHLPARASGASRTVTSALSSHRSRCRKIGRSWLNARASIVALIPPAEAPARMSTMTCSSTLWPIFCKSSKK